MSPGATALAILSSLVVRMREPGTDRLDNGMAIVPVGGVKYNFVLISLFSEQIYLYEYLCPL